MCDSIWGAGNTLVAGTPGTSFTITFQGILANTRMGGKISLTNSTFTAGSSPSVTQARTTPGSAGAGQFDIYTQAGTNNNPTAPRAFLKYDWVSNPQGGESPDGGGGNQGSFPLAYRQGYFNVADLTGLDTNAMTTVGFRLVDGNAITDTGASIALG